MLQGSVQILADVGGDEFIANGRWLHQIALAHIEFRDDELETHPCNLCQKMGQLSL
ncbi:hypothetical protein D9M68_986950 [compost metagenome]